MSSYRCEYIQGSSGQYIDSGYVPNGSRTKIELKAQSLADIAFFFGTRTTSTATDSLSFTLLSQSNGFRLDHLGKSYRIEISPSSVHNIILDTDSISIDGAVTNITSSASNGYGNLYITSANTKGVSDGRSSIRLYYFKIYDNNVLVRDFIPYVKDNTVGLLDKLTSEFYPNKGSGVYSSGPRIKSGFNVNVNGQWKESESSYVNVNGAWKEIDSVYVNINGTWKEAS